MRLELSALGVVLGAIRRVDEHGGVVAVAGADPRRGVGRALRSFGVEHLFLLSDAPAQALEWLDAVAASPTAAVLLQPVGLGG